MLAWRNYVVVGLVLVAAGLVTLGIPVKALDGTSCGSGYGATNGADESDASVDAGAPTCDGARAQARELPLAMVVTGLGLFLIGAAPLLKRLQSSPDKGLTRTRAEAQD